MNANPVHQSADASRVVEPVGLLGQSWTRRALVEAILAAPHRAWRLNPEPIDEVQVAWYSQAPASSWESGRRSRQQERIAMPTTAQQPLIWR